MKEIIYNFFIVFILSILIFNSFMLGYNYNIYKNSEISTNLKYDKSNCKNYSLFDTAKCLNKQLNKFYVYNVSNTNKKINMSIFKIEGGVCSHASKYYKDNAQKLGFHGTTCIMDVYEENNTIHQHEIAIISNKEGYVILDQNNIIGKAYFNINSTIINNEK